MKKAILATLTIIAVCSLCFAGTVNALKPGYTCWNFQGADVTIDGKYTTDGEWTDSYKDWLYSGWTKSSSFYRIKWGFNPMISDKWLIEFASDTTNDTGDFFVLCYDGSADGGSAPQANDYMVSYVGHTNTTVYRGTGSGWAVASDVSVPGQVQVKDTLTATALSATPHWVIEVIFDKSGAISGTGIDTGVRLAVYDASNVSAGVLMWPPMTNRDVINDYGLCDADITGGTIPEGLTVGIMVLLSSVAVIVSSRYFRRQSKIESYSSVKL